METKELEQGDSLLEELEEKEIQGKKERRQEYWRELKLAMFALLIGLAVICSVIVGMLLEWYW